MCFGLSGYGVLSFAHGYIALACGCGVSGAIVRHMSRVISLNIAFSGGLAFGLRVSGAIGSTVGVLNFVVEGAQSFRGLRPVVSLCCSFIQSGLRCYSLV